MKTSTKLLVGAGVGVGAYAFYKAGGVYIALLYGAMLVDAVKQKLSPHSAGPFVVDNNPVGPPTTGPTGPVTVLTVAPTAAKPAPLNIGPVILTRA